jgi:hypothetical protein
VASRVNDPGVLGPGAACRANSSVISSTERFFDDLREPGQMKNTQTTTSARLTPAVEVRRRTPLAALAGGVQLVRRVAHVRQRCLGAQVTEREAVQRVRHERQGGADIGRAVPEQEAAGRGQQRQRPAAPGLSAPGLSGPGLAPLRPLLTLVG